jgi:hypothetical protein
MGCGYQGDVGPLETDPSDATRIYKWNLSREYDSHVDPAAAAPGSPNTSMPGASHVRHSRFMPK